VKIAVGSDNPVKVRAVQSVVSKIWPAASIVFLPVDSGVSAMPMNDRECRIGAHNRALIAQQDGASDIGIGLEAGVSDTFGTLMLMGWIVAVDSSGKAGLGGTARLPLPKHIAIRVVQGEELGHVIDDIMGDRDIKKKGGTIGALTAGLVVRQQAFETAVAYALSPFLTPDLYSGHC